MASWLRGVEDGKNGYIAPWQGCALRSGDLQYIPAKGDSVSHTLLLTRPVTALVNKMLQNHNAWVHSTASAGPWYFYSDSWGFTLPSGGLGSDQTPVKKTKQMKKRLPTPAKGTLVWPVPRNFRSWSELQMVSTENVKTPAGLSSDCWCLHCSSP